MEIITRGERRRSWTPEQKREIVAESLGPELTPTEVARKHAISSGQLYTWRQQVLSVPGRVVTRASAEFCRGRADTRARRHQAAVRTCIAAACAPATSAPSRPEG